MTRDFRGFSTPQRGSFPLDANFRQTLPAKLSWGASHGVALQLHQAAHVVGEVLQPDPRLGPHQYAEGIDTLGLKDAKAPLDGIK